MTMFKKLRAWLADWWHQRTTSNYEPPVPRSRRRLPSPAPDLGRIRPRMIRYLSDQRSLLGLQDLLLNFKLCCVAQRYAERMAERGKQVPDRPEDLLRRLCEEHYIAADVRQNTACGTVQACTVIDTWLASFTHRANLLDPDCFHAGFGVAAGRDGRWYWCAVLACPAWEQAPVWPHLAAPIEVEEPPADEP